MRISDWSSDVCSSDLRAAARWWSAPFPRGSGARDSREDHPRKPPSPRGRGWRKKRPHPPGRDDRRLWYWLRRPARPPAFPGNSRDAGKCSKPRRDRRFEGDGMRRILHLDTSQTLDYVPEQRRARFRRSTGTEREQRQQHGFTPASAIDCIGECALEGQRRHCRTPMLDGTEQTLPITIRHRLAERFEQRIGEREAMVGLFRRQRTLRRHPWIDCLLVGTGAFV